MQALFCSGRGPDPDPDAGRREANRPQPAARQIGSPHCSRVQWAAGRARAGADNRADPERPKGEGGKLPDSALPATAYSQGGLGPADLQRSRDHIPVDNPQDGVVTATDFFLEKPSRVSGKTL